MKTHLTYVWQLIKEQNKWKKKKQQQQQQNIK